MIHTKPATKNVISVIETNLNDVMKDEIFQAIIREDLDCILMKFPFKRDENGVPTWMDMVVNLFFNGGFEEEYEKKDKDKS